MLSKFEIKFQNMETLELNFQKLKFLEDLFLKELKKIFKDCEIYLVGGGVRDFILKKEIKDFDFVIRNIEIKDLEKFLSKFGQVNLVGRVFGVLKFLPFKNWEKKNWIDIALPRKEHAFGTGGYKDFEVQSNPKLPIEEDLSRRDFTINAMALKIFGEKKYELIDPFGGKKDLEKKIIKAVGDPKERFKEDYSRMLRAIRFACQLDFSIEERTWEEILKNISHLNDVYQEKRVVPYETIAKEFLKSFYYQPIKAFDLYDLSNAFSELIPEILKMKNCPQPEIFHSEGDVWTHTKLALEKLFSDDFKKQFNDERPSIELIISVLFHDIGKPFTIKTPEKDGTDRIRFNDHDIVGAKIAKEICERLRFSSPEEINVDPERIFLLVKHHMFLIHGEIEKIKATTIEKYFFNPQFPGENLLKLAFVDISSTIPKDGKPDFSNFYKMIEKIEEVKKILKVKKELPKPLLNGYEIMEILNLKPGPKIGEIKNLLREEQLSGRIKNKEEAIRFLKLTKI
jgi:poly(A) polymerase